VIFIRSGSGHYDHQPGFVAVGDELLCPVQHPIIAVQHRVRHLRRGVGTRAGLGDRESAECLVAGQHRHESRLLLGSAELQDRHGRLVLGGENDPGGSARSGQFLDDQDETKIVGPAAAILRGIMNPRQIEFGQFLHSLGREPLIPVQLRGKGFNMRSRKLPRDRLEQLLLVGQQKSHSKFPSVILTSEAGRKPLLRPGTPFAHMRWPAGPYRETVNATPYYRYVAKSMPPRLPPRSFIYGNSGGNRGK